MTTSAPSPPDMANLKLLLVDDDAIALEEMGETFEIEGWRHVTATSIEKALDMLEADEDIRVVVTDVNFVDPNGKAANGIQFVSRAKARFPDRPLSYLVFSGDPEAWKASVQVGVLTFLCKPFLAHELVEAVEKAVARGAHDTERASETVDVGSGMAESA